MWRLVFTVESGNRGKVSLTTCARPMVRALVVTCIAGGALRAQVRVSGSITDSLTGRPLVGAMVQIQRDSAFSTLSATTDSTGAYRIEGAAPGGYIAGFFHAKLDSLGISLSPRRLVIAAGSDRRLDFAVPSAKTIVASVCPQAATNDSLGLLLGYVRDAETALPKVSSVTVQWMELVIGDGGIRRNRQLIPVKTNDEGWFAFCGLPTDIDLAASAQSGSAESGVIEVRVPPGGLLLQDLLVSEADSTVVIYGDTTVADSLRQRVATLRRGRARIEGVVRSDKGKPVANAEVSVPGTGLSVRTPDAGTFSISGLPSGTQSVEVRAFGFTPKRVTVALARDRLTTVNVTFDRPVATLDVVKVYGKGRSALAQFERRRRAGWGRFLTPADIEQRHAIRVSDLFRTMPSVRVVPSGAFGNIILVRGCVPTIYLNGMRLGDDAAADLDMLASPSEITAVEVYTPAGRPAEFFGNHCGSVVLWAGMLPR